MGRFGLLPLAALGTFLLMRLTGMSANLMSLGGLAIATPAVERDEQRERTRTVPAGGHADREATIEGALERTLERGPRRGALAAREVWSLQSVYLSFPQ